MTTVPAPAMTRRFGESRWAQFAAVVLVAMGTVMLVSVLVPNNYGFGTILMVVGIINLVLGIAVWRHHLWARLLAVVTCAAGIWLGWELMPSAFFPVSTSEPGSTWPMLRLELILSIVPYVAVIVGLVLGGRHFRRIWVA